ncbi:MAG TPA: hypothetical protein VNY29_04845 [Terriglobales bacterium]|nr:hypothetical protein [Terriglobales bacterium]
MAQPQEKSHDRTSTLPNPELNPMVNPTLGRNLGRWAQVYFTTPPEKREQAVVELLRELEAEAEPLPPSPTSAAIYEVPKRPVALEPGDCTECGHPSSPGQRFCGMCGSALLSEQQSVTVSAEEPSLTTEDGPAKNVPQPVFPTLSLFAEVLEEPSRPSDGNGTSEIQWLRDRNLAARSRQWNPVKYGIALVGVVFLGLVYYANSRRSNASQPPPQTVPAAAVVAENPALVSAPVPAPPRAANQPTPSSVVVAADPPVSSPAAAPSPRPAVTASRPNSVVVTAVPRKPETPLPLPAIPATASGSLELATAQDYLTGKNRPRDSAAAATFLWAAVRKENTAAVLVLSELYLAGDGVPKNCAQARILLMAAARKQIPEAVTRLRQLETSGCP